MQQETQWTQDENGAYIMPPKQRLFVAWLTTPNWERPDDQRTSAGFARVNDVHPDSLKRWKRDPRFKAELDRALMELNISAERTQRVVDSIWMAANNGDMKAAALYLQYVGQFMPTRKVVHEERLVSALTDEELARELEAEAAKVRGS